MKPEEPVVSASLGAQPATSRKRVAVLAIHGIGEQVQFETLAKAADGLARVHAQSELLLWRARGPDRKHEPRPKTPAVEARGVAIEGVELRRAEVTIGETDVHVYEAYWAPFTKGKVTLRAAMAFLVRGAWSGIRNGLTGFRRFMFGGVKEHKHEPWTLGALVVASLVLASLVVVDAVALAVAASQGGLPDRLPQRALDEGTWFGLLFLLTLVALGIWMAAARSARAALRRVRGTAAEPVVRALARGVVLVTWGLAGVTMLATIGVGVALVWLIASNGAVPWAPASAPPTIIVVAVWTGLVGASLLARQVLIDFIGDIAAYVSPQKLDDFREVREEIKAAAKKIATAVYSQDYERIMIVGHSLGSVVAYDTLNALLRDDDLAQGRGRDALGRTRLLLTFGSPLDKTAFIFATAKGGLSPTREALATLSQPLILDERFRQRIRWVNVYSRADPVSGKLDYYGRPLEDKPDPDAMTPFVAHNEYWENDLVWSIVIEEIERVDASPGPQTRVKLAA